MKKTFCILIISMFLFVGCDNQKNILDKEKDLKEEIKLLNSYDNIDITSEKKLNESNELKKYNNITEYNIDYSTYL